MPLKGGGGVWWAIGSLGKAGEALRASARAVCGAAVGQKCIVEEGSQLDET